MGFVTISAVGGVRTAEEWTTGGAIAGLALVLVVVAALAWALYVTGRR